MTNDPMAMTPSSGCGNAVTGRALTAGLIALVAVAACEREPPEEMVAELEQLEAERDELQQRVQELEERADALEDLRQRVGEVELPAAVRQQLEEDPPATAEDSVMVAVEGLRDQADALRGELGGARGQAAALRERVDSIQTAHREAEEEWESRLAQEEERSSELDSRLADVQGEREDLEQEVATLQGQIQDLRAEAAEVYFAAGTREELLERGIIEEEGGARVILGLFWKRGESLVPGRDLDPADFQRLDRRDADVIPLPRDDVAYHVISRQNLAYMSPTPGSERRIQGGADAIQITNPEAFWRNSRFLILMQEE